MNELKILKEYCEKQLEMADGVDFTMWSQMNRAFGALELFNTLYPDLEEFANSWWNNIMRPRFYC